MDDLASPEEPARAITHEVNAMRQLIHNLSLLTRVEAGVFELQFTRCRPEDLVADVLDRFMCVSEERGPPLATELSEGPSPVYADRERVG